MLVISIKDNIAEKMKVLSDAQRDQLPFATAKALTQTAKDVQARLTREMSSVFDRPTPYTLNSLRTKPATKSNLSAFVWFKDDAGKGTPATKYLLPEVIGGDRHMKRFERALNRLYILPAGMMIVPGASCPIDAYGNIAKGEIVRILAFFQAFKSDGPRKNSTDASRNKMKVGTKRKYGEEYFVIRQSSKNLHPGVWKRVGTGFGKSIKPILFFVTKPHYKTRLRFDAISNEVTQKELPINFQLAWAEAMRTAR